MLHSKVLCNDDFDSAWYNRWKPIFHAQDHRKTWENAAIAEAIIRDRSLFSEQPKGLGFGVGSEQLSSLFARHHFNVIATDQPLTNEARENWLATSQIATGLDSAFHPHLVDKEVFEKYVSFEPRDMRDAVHPEAGTFDFIWSNGSLEHIGSIGESVTFILESLKNLTPTGIAVHTTEFNLNRNGRHVTHGGTIHFRADDLDELEVRLAAIGYTMRPYSWDTDIREDQIDGVPNRDPHHRALESGGIQMTSVLLIIRPV